MSRRADPTLGGGILVANDTHEPLLGFFDGQNETKRLPGRSPTKELGEEREKAGPSAHSSRMPARRQRSQGGAIR